ncbi:MAG: hypothetical protein M1820_006535 [Bogoriella megaspora]|nr:MAG: hypothetical protein M1820_006535 [Bogoriella megaspora]
MSREFLAFSGHNEAAVRLYLQHWICQYQMGFLLHPSIPTGRTDLKVLDIACGTGVWLVDLSRSLPHAQLDGFDISDAHFPTQAELPSNVHLQVQDALKPVPKELLGKYDIVHVGRISMFVRNENPTPIVQNFLAMLKPGGFLQWDELDSGGMNAKSFSNDTHYVHFAEIIVYFRAWLAAQKCTSQWLNELPTLFEDLGISVHAYERLPIGDHMSKPWSEMQLMAYRDFMEHDVIPSTQDDPKWPSPDKWREMLQGVHGECQQGLRVFMDMVFIVGQKSM